MPVSETGTTEEPPLVTSSTPDDTTAAPVNTGNADSENIGNTGAGNSEDKNQPTGVPLVVVPAALAAIALSGSLIAKRRK